MKPVIDLRGKVVLLSGGSRGIGAAAVRALHGAGAHVFFTFHQHPERAQALAETLDDRVAFARCELSDQLSLPAIVDQCVGRFGGLDVLVNNAAIYDDNAFDRPDYDGWHAGWQRTFAVNLFGAADLAWLAMRHMRAHGGGRIVNVASRAAHRGELRSADYGASKAALINLTKSIARSCAKDGITALAIAPGYVETEMAQADLLARRAELEAEVPLRYIASAEEVGDIIAFACSPIATYANGATIDVNGGSYVR